MSETRNAALALGAEGFRVFPLPCGQKAAKLPQWGARATTDSTQIEEWFPTGDPSPNVGNATGRGLLVIDEDPRHGSDISIADLQVEHGELPATRTVRTPSGGRHRYFRVPSELRVPNSTGKLGPGIDTRGDGGYVVAPPSTLVEGAKQTAGAYTWENDLPVADAPAWLIERATEKRARQEFEPDTTAPRNIEPHNVTLADAESMVKHLDANADYDDWTGILWSVRRTGLGTQDGTDIGEWFALGNEWSQGSKKYDGQSFATIRDKMLEADKQPGYGWRYLIETARAAGFVPTDEQQLRWRLTAAADDFPLTSPEASKPARWIIGAPPLSVARCGPDGTSGCCGVCG